MLCKLYLYDCIYFILILIVTNLMENLIRQSSKQTDKIHFIKLKCLTMPGLFYLILIPEEDSIFLLNLKDLQP